MARPEHRDRTDGEGVIPRLLLAVLLLVVSYQVRMSWQFSETCNRQHLKEVSPLVQGFFT